MCKLFHGLPNMDTLPPPLCCRAMIMGPTPPRSSATLRSGWWRPTCRETMPEVRARPPPVAAPHSRRVSDVLFWFTAARTQPWNFGNPHRPPQTVAPAHGACDTARVTQFGVPVNADPVPLRGDACVEGLPGCRPDRARGAAGSCAACNRARSLVIRPMPDSA